MQDSLIKCILVVDDDPTNRIVMQDILQSSGYTCVVAEDASVALNLLHQEPFDLVITDIKMPDKDGIELMREAREQLPQLNFIVMTGYAAEYTYSDIIAAGAADFIAKPINSSELQAKLQRINRETSLLRELQQKEEALSNYNANLQGLVEERTRELKITNEQLQQEISDRKQSELQAILQRDLSLALSGAVSLGEAMFLAIEAGTRMASMDCGGMYLVNPTSGAFDLKFHQDMPAEFIEMTSRYEANSPQACLLRKGHASYSTYQQLCLPSRADKELQATALIPICHQGEVIACLALGSATSEEVPREARDALETIVPIIGSAIVRITAEKRLATISLEKCHS